MNLYETPEVFEIGEAAELTLGCPGRVPDGCCGCNCGGGCGGGNIDEIEPAL